MKFYTLQMATDGSKEFNVEIAKTTDLDFETLIEYKDVVWDREPEISGMRIAMYQDNGSGISYIGSKNYSRDGFIPPFDDQIPF